MTDTSPNEQSRVAVLFELENGIRNATSMATLEFLMVNQTSRLVPCDQVVFLSFKRPGHPPKVKAISGVAAVDRNIPFVNWVEKMAAREHKGPKGQAPHVVDWEELSDYHRENRDALSPSQVFWLPVVSPLLGPLGILWLARSSPWEDAGETTLLDHLSLSYAHGLQGFLGKKSLTGSLVGALKRPLALVLVAAVCLAMFFPVTLSALGSARIVPRDAFVLTAPFQSVVKEILVRPNQTITPGQTLARLEDQEMRNLAEVSVKAMEVAQAQLLRAQRAAFNNVENRETLAELEARVDMRRAELAYARDQLGKTILKADKAGVAVVNRPDLWRGRPVSPGQSILQVADPGQVEVEIMLPVKDAILLEPGNRVRIFLDKDPLSVLEARILRFEYDPQLTEMGTLAYVITAEFIHDTEPPRIGLSGTAKVYGPSVTLFYYLFRRPITLVRQWWGV